MRSKSPLALMEQLVMVLVFALAAALCVQAFVLADGRSQQTVDRDHALLEAQNVAETLKSCRGDYQEAAELCRGTWDGADLKIFYDENWQIVTEECSVYTLTVIPADSASALLGRAEVAVTENDGAQICTLPAAWQEVEKHA